MTMHAAMPVDAKPRCADPDVRVELDHATSASGRNSNRVRDAFAQRHCVGCPVADACLAFALENNEHGFWAGTSDNQRTRTRGSMSYTHNLRGLHTSGPRGLE